MATEITRSNLPANAAARIRKYAAEGRSTRAIAALIGIGRKTLDKLFADEQNADLLLAFEIGRAEHEHFLIEKLLAIATGEVEHSNPSGVIYLLKAMHGLLEVSEARAGPAVVINLPQPLEPAKYLEIVQPGQLPKEKKDGKA